MVRLYYSSFCSFQAMVDCNQNVLVFHFYFLGKLLHVSRATLLKSSIMEMLLSSFILDFINLLLDDSNYQTWFTCCMDMFLHQKEKYYGRVNNSIIRPTNRINQATWDIIKAEVRGFFFFFFGMKNNQIVHAKSLETSKEIWDKIKT